MLKHNFPSVALFLQDWLHHKFDILQWRCWFEVFCVKFFSQFFPLQIRQHIQKWNPLSVSTWRTMATNSLWMLRHAWKKEQQKNNMHHVNRHQLSFVWFTLNDKNVLYEDIHVGLNKMESVCYISECTTCIYIFWAYQPGVRALFCLCIYILY